MPPSEKGKGHTGIKLGRGSTLGLADVRIEKGQVRGLPLCSDYDWTVNAIEHPN